MRIFTGCLRRTPTGYLPIRSGIQPAELCRQGATLSLAHRSVMDVEIMRSQRGAMELKARGGDEIQ